MWILSYTHPTCKTSITMGRRDDVAETLIWRYMRVLGFPFSPWLPRKVTKRDAKSMLPFYDTRPSHNKVKNRYLMQSDKLSFYHYSIFKTVLSSKWKKQKALEVNIQKFKRNKEDKTQKGKCLITLSFILLWSPSAVWLFPPPSKPLNTLTLLIQALDQIVSTFETLMTRRCVETTTPTTTESTPIIIMWHVYVVTEMRCFTGPSIMNHDAHQRTMVNFTVSLDSEVLNLRLASFSLALLTKKKFSRDVSQMAYLDCFYNCAME